MSMRIEPVTDGLQTISTASSKLGMRFWEYKDQNMHRGIIDFEASTSLSRAQIEAEVRRQTVETYLPTWARGFAFGAVIQFEKTPDFPLKEFAACVDDRNKSKGVWQWVIAIDHERHTAYAAHMWMQGTLHPMFDKTVNNLSALRYQVSREYLPKPRLFRGIDSYLKFAPKAIHALKQAQLALLAIFVVYLIYAYFD